MAQKEIEERPVEKSALSSGVKLKGGHAVHLLVGGVKAAGSGTGHGGGHATGEASGQGGGSDDGDPTSG
jgi:hypothetical protein